MTKVEELRRTAVAKSAVDLIIYDPDAVTEDGGQVRIVRSAETNLGDLCADAFRIQAGADIGYKVGGSIRVQLPAGDLTFNDFFNVHPFGNSLAMIEVTGQQVLDALEWGVHSMPQEFGGFPQVSGLTFEIDVSVPSRCLTDENGMFDRVEEGAERRVRNVLVGGEPLDPEKIYTLAGDNYTLLNYGDGYTMFGGAPVLLNGSTLDHQVLVDYITDRLGGVINEGYTDPYGQGRIVSVPAE